MNEVGARLQAFREAQDPPLSKAQAAALVPVSRGTWFRWESGKRNIDEAMLPRVSEFTGIPMRELRPDLARLFGEAAE